MAIKINEATGKIRYSGSKEIKFSSLVDLVSILKNETSTLPEFIYVFGVDSDKNVHQLVLDFNSLSQQKIDIKDIRFKRFQKYLGDILVEKKVITREKLTAALKMREKSSYNERLGEILVRLGYVKSDQIIEALNEQLGFKLK